MRERSKPEEPGSRKNQKPDKICKKEENQLNQKASFRGSRRVEKCEEVGHFQVRVSWQEHLHISQGCGGCSGTTALHLQVLGVMSNLPGTA